jgi:hypothetical protein
MDESVNGHEVSLEELKERFRVGDRISHDLAICPFDGSSSAITSHT